MVTFPVSSSVSHPAGRERTKGIKKGSKTFPAEQPTSEASLREPHRHISIFTFTSSSCSLVLSACLDVCTQKRGHHIQENKPTADSYWLFCFILHTCSFTGRQHLYVTVSHCVFFVLKQETGVSVPRNVCIYSD